MGVPRDARAALDLDGRSCERSAISSCAEAMTVVESLEMVEGGEV